MTGPDPRKCACGCGEALIGRRDKKYINGAHRNRAWEARHPRVLKKAKGQSPAWVEWCGGCQAFTDHANIDTHTRRRVGHIRRERLKQCLGCGNRLHTLEVPR